MRVLSVVVATAAAAGGCVPALDVDLLACDGGGAPVGRDLLPLDRGSCWENRVTSPDATKGVTYKQTTLLAKRTITTACGDDGDLDATTDVVPLQRTVSDGSSALRFMSTGDDGAIWWEEDRKQGSPDDPVAVTDYCSYTGTAAHANDVDATDPPALQGDGRKLRVPDMARIAQLTWQEPYAERKVKDGVVTISFCTDDWHVDTDDNGAPLHHERTVPAGTFDVIPIHREGQCFPLAGPDDDVPPAPEHTEALFEFAPGVGKIYERTENQEIEELMTWRIGELR